MILAHFWLAFAGFGVALLLGEWQMFIRSPLHAWIGDPELYYRSVTAHGTTMAYVLPTLVAMGFGYFVTEAALERPLIGLRWAWLGFASWPWARSSRSSLSPSDELRCFTPSTRR